MQVVRSGFVVWDSVVINDQFYIKEEKSNLLFLIK